MLHWLLLGLDEINSGKIAVKWNLIYGDEMSWRADISSLSKGKEKSSLSMAVGSEGMWLLVWPQPVGQCCFCEFFITELQVVGWV